jgi:hypothetical protein
LKTTIKQVLPKKIKDNEQLYTNLKFKELKLKLKIRNCINYEIEETCQDKHKIRRFDSSEMFKKKSKITKHLLGLGRILK